MSKVGIDCEMIQDNQNRNICIRVFLVDGSGNKIYDSFVKPSSYSVEITGLTANHVNGGKDFYQVRDDVMNLIHNKILVGHSVNVYLNALGLAHCIPAKYIRDIAEMPKFKHGDKKRNLKDLAREYLGISIQERFHDPLEDAKAAMRLYNL